MTSYLWWLVFETTLEVELESLYGWLLSDVKYGENLSLERLYLGRNTFGGIVRLVVPRSWSCWTKPARVIRYEAIRSREGLRWYALEILGTAKW